MKRELSPKVTEGLFFGIILFLTIPPSRLREPPPFTQGRLITARPYAKGVRTNRPYSFCCRAGVHLPPLSSPFSLVFGGSKPPPYDIMGRKNLLYGRHPLGCFCLYPYSLLKQIGKHLLLVLQKSLCDQVTQGFFVSAEFDLAVIEGKDLCIGTP